ncbi:MAG: rhodanese-like domain-containing protein [Chloroflexi bacterium]|nr:rhodanese-like domain-containing protein [Chloroflexota bacterium]
MRRRGVDFFGRPPSRRDLIAAPVRPPGRGFKQPTGHGQRPSSFASACHFARTVWAYGHHAAGKQVVAYDDTNGGIAARLWWLLRYMGHEAAAVLNGGWAAWQEGGFPRGAV